MEAYKTNTQPKVGDKCVVSERTTKCTVETVGGGRLGNKVGVKFANGQSREYYYYCLFPVVAVKN